MIVLQEQQYEYLNSHHGILLGRLKIWIQMIVNGMNKSRIFESLGEKTELMASQVGKYFITDNYLMLFQDENIS